MATTTDRTSELGRTLRNLREAAEWSRETLAKKSGVSVATVARIELYGRSPSLGVLRSLAGALGIPAAALLSPEPETAAP